jgi:hypothetical protein
MSTIVTKYISIVDALSDSLRSVELDSTNLKGYLRQGIALFHLNRKDEALKVFRSGLDIDGKFIVLADVDINVSHMSH